MKKVKAFAILVIILSVVALGIYLGKQAFRYLENRSLPAGQQPTTPGAIPDQVPANPQVLYSSTAAQTPDTGLPKSPEPAPAPTAPPLPTSSDPAVSPPVSPPPGQPATLQAAASITTPLPTTGKWVAFASGDGVNVRESPNLTSKKIMKVSGGTKGTIVERKDGWTKVKWDFNRKTGWTRDDLILIGPEDVMKNLVDNKGHVASFSQATISAQAKKAIEMARTVNVGIAKPMPPSESVRGFVPGKSLPKEATITADPIANIRSSPDRKALVVGKIPKGVVVQVKNSKQIGRFTWFEIVFNNGRKEGWTREDNLQF